jgi:hypothetical protein
MEIKKALSHPLNELKWTKKTHFTTPKKGVVAHLKDFLGERNRPYLPYFKEKMDLKIK